MVEQSSNETTLPDGYALADILTRFNPDELSEAIEELECELQGTWQKLRHLKAIQMILYHYHWYNDGSETEPLFADAVGKHFELLEQSLEKEAFQLVRKARIEADADPDVPSEDALKALKEEKEEEKEEKDEQDVASNGWTTHREILTRILRESGEPQTARQLADEARRRNHRTDIDDPKRYLRILSNTLSYTRDDFYVENEKWGLVEWTRAVAIKDDSEPQTQEESVSLTANEMAARLKLRPLTTGELATEFRCAERDVLLLITSHEERFARLPGGSKWGLRTTNLD